MRIRELTLDDYDDALALWEQAEHLGPVSRDEVARKLARDPELFLVAEDGDALVGVVMGAFDGRRGWIFRLAVDPSRQRAGIGRALVAELETRFAALGAPQVNLLVFDGNQDGVAFWESLGYPGFGGVRLHTKRLDGARAADGEDAEPHHPNC